MNSTDRAIAVVLGVVVLAILAYLLFTPTTSTPPTATSTPITATTTATTTTTTTDTSWEDAFTIVTQANTSAPVALAKSQRFIIKFGHELNWSLVFDPANGITRVANSTTEDGIQGIYEADQVGTTILHATGAPICKAGEACPHFLVAVTITFVVH